MSLRHRMNPVRSMRFAAAILAAMAFASVAHADDAVRVVIAGPKNDSIAARLAKELVALGFEPVLVGPLGDCAAAAVTAAVKDAAASAALCSDGEQVGVWTDDGKDLKLRDVIAPRKNGAHARDQVAMRAAEVARANLAFREPEPAPAEPVKPLSERPSPASQASQDWDRFEHSIDTVPPRKVDPGFTPTVAVSGGMSYLASTSASISGLSGHVAVGVHRYFSITGRVDAALGSTQATPISTNAAPDRSHVRVSPGIAGVGIELPFAKTSDRFVPRLGAAIGVAWLHAEKSPGIIVATRGASSFQSTTQASADTIAAMAGWLSGALSVRVAGPLRVVGEGLIGSTAGRLVIRNQNVVNSRWGAPLAALALRAEVAFQ